MNKITILAILLISFVLVGCDNKNNQNNGDTGTKHNITLEFKMADYTQFGVQAIQFENIQVNTNETGVVTFEYTGELGEQKADANIICDGYDLFVFDVAWEGEMNFHYIIYAMEKGKCNFETDFIKISGCC